MPILGNEGSEVTLGSAVRTTTIIILMHFPQIFSISISILFSNISHFITQEEYTGISLVAHWVKDWCCNCSGKGWCCGMGLIPSPGGKKWKKDNTYIVESIHCTWVLCWESKWVLKARWSHSRRRDVCCYKDPISLSSSMSLGLFSPQREAFFSFDSVNNLLLCFSLTQALLQQFPPHPQPQFSWFPYLQSTSVQ